MSRLQPLTVWRRMALDARLPAKTRLEAFNQISRPSLNLLRRLLSAKTTPSKLKLAAARKYELEVARKELKCSTERR
jgi:hypothetical protein